jgi:hypothetical protein
MSTKGFSFNRTPTLQHASYLIGPDVPTTANNIHRLRKGAPPYRLAVARQLIVAVLKGQSFEWAKRQADTIADEALRRATKEILFCLKQYLTSVRVSWFRTIETFPYPIGRGLVIPINPLGMISDGEKIRLLWPQLWRTRTLNPMQFNVFGGVLERAVYAVEPDITELEWMEMSVPAGAADRELRLRGRDAYAPISDEELAATLDRLAEAVEIVNGEPPAPGRKRSSRDDRTGDLFGRGGEK